MSKVSYASCLPIYVNTLRFGGVAIERELDEEQVKCGVDAEKSRHGPIRGSNPKFWPKLFLILNAKIWNFPRCLLSIGPNGRV